MNFEALLKEWASQAGVDETQAGDMVKIVENAMLEKEAAVTVALTEKHEAELNEYKEDVKEHLALLEQKYKDEHETLVESVAEYTDTVAKDFVKEHKEQLVTTEQHNKLLEQVDEIKVTFAKLGLVEDVDARIKERDEQISGLNEQIAGLNEQIQTETRKVVFAEATEDLSDVQRDKVAKLVESATTGGFTGNYQALVENFVSLIAEKAADEKDESDDDADEKTSDKKENGQMNESEKISKYAAYLSSNRK